VPDILRVLAGHGVDARVCDPHADPQQAKLSFGLTLEPLPAEGSVDALVLAVPHQAFLAQRSRLVASIKPGGLIMDVKSVLSPEDIPAACTYWSL
jgi:UDP-N-acetyl-D-galactosamine dehydrogenase